MGKVSVKRIFIVVGIYSVIANLAHPITPTMIMNLNLGDYMFGVAFASMSFVSFLFSPFWGKIADQVGSIKVSAMCFMGYAVGQAVFALAQTEFQIVLGRMIAGFFIGGIMVCQLVYIMSVSSKEKCGVNLAISATVGAVLSPFGFLVGGFIGSYSMPLTFLIQVVGLFLIGMGYPMFLKDKEEERIPISKKALIREANPFKLVMNSRKIMTPAIMCFLAMAFFGTLAVTSHEQAFNFFLNDQYGVPPSYNGMIKAVVGFMALLANSTICLWIMKKTDVQKSIVGIFIALTITIGILMFVNTQAMFIAQNLIIFGFIAVYMPVIQAVLAALSSGNQGVLIGIFSSIRSLGMVVGSLSAGFIYSVEAKLPFLVATIAFGIAAILGIVNYLQIQKNKKEDPLSN